MASTVQKLKYHPAADAFPMMDKKRHLDLQKDIEAHGLIMPLILCEGKILDGRNRYEACKELGIPLKTKEYKGDPWTYVWSLNGERRDLVAEQRYLIWRHCNKESKAWQAEQEKIKEKANKARSKAAKAQPRTKGGKRLAEKEDQVVDHSVPPPDKHKGRKAKAKASKTSKGAVARGDVLASKRPDLAEKVRTGKMKPAEAHRQMKKDEVKEKTKALPAGKYAVIYADCPWKYGDERSGENVTATGALHHYPTMSLKELKALDIKELSASDSVLFLWATSPLLPEALEVMKAWGFHYKSSFIWYKVKHNLGHYNSVRHEFLLIGTKGSFTPQGTKLHNSVQTKERRAGACLCL